MNRIEQFLQDHKVLILDGAMATELESKGLDLNDALWSAKVLAEQPDVIEQVHYEYFQAGADCAMTASYQATIDGFLKKHNIIGLFGIDTRRLTRIIRETGVMNGMITTSEPTDEFKAQALERIRAYVVGPVVPKVSVKQPEKFSAENGKYKVALMDYGYKFNIRRELVKRGCDVTVFPYDTSAEEILKFAPDGIMLSNGPGDPQDNTVSINTLKELIPHKIPTFGICLGHQHLALANGATTVKLKYGHRGGNQPVTDVTVDRTFITSQNHGYAVVSDSLPESAGKVSHINGNDKTCEGVMYTNAPAFTVQFHPEACGGPHDTAYLFDKFISLMEENKKCR